MKPADHPDFFRLPPPPGRSRESAIVLDESGRFFDHGQEVEHPGMQAAFRSWLDRHPDDGRPILNNGYDWTYITVEGPAFRVRAVRRTDAGLVLALDDGSEELLGGDVWVESDGALWVTVKGGRFQARLEPGAQASLGDVLVETPNGLALWSPEGPREVAPRRPSEGRSD